MWTAIIKSKERVNNGVKITIAYTNDKEPEKNFEESIFTASHVPDSWLAQSVRTRIKDMESTKTLFDSLVEGSEIDYQLKDPVQDEIDRRTFLTDLSNLSQMKKAVEAGLKKPDDQDFIDLEAKIKSEFKDEYKVYL